MIRDCMLVESSAAVIDRFDSYIDIMKWLQYIAYRISALTHYPCPPPAQLYQSKTTAAQRTRPLDSTSDPHLHINGQPQAPLLRPQHRGVPSLTKVRLPHNNHQTGQPPFTHTSTLKIILLHAAMVGFKPYGAHCTTIRTNWIHCPWISPHSVAN